MRAALRAGWLGVAVLLSACGVNASLEGTDESERTTGVTITVDMFNEPPPKATLAAFTKATGIAVNWVVTDWDSLQTKILAATKARRYFADATDVDWSRVGQLSRLSAFYPMETLIDTKALAEDMPQLTSFTSHGHVIGIPYDAMFDVLTVNKEMFAAAGVSATPATMEEYTAALWTIKSKGVAAYPLSIPFAPAEGLSTYWYQVTAAFGGTVLDEKHKQHFADPASPGYRAAKWMVDAYRGGLVPPGNLDLADGQAQQTVMAKGLAASTFADYSGNIGTLYDVPSASSVVHKIAYVATPGTPVNNSIPDGIGVPVHAKYPKAAARFIEWFTSAGNQADFAGINGVDKAMPNYSLPSHLSAVRQLAEKGQLIGGAELATMLKTSSRPIFGTGAPSWYPHFSAAVYTHLHAAAAGEESVDTAVRAIAAVADRLSSRVITVGE
ncbi:ABC transporter substrate-binding protein [Virgisporangium aliadipatigenens]|uniref:ABC transporter substrate-binding protein n=1 Tax=Virgisporangium aliadipatigenens TaxID=741659 RepID=UPI0019437255|nr:extracellular solute-binding protein [Virgisporangium aliadipatigenens]